MCLDVSGVGLFGENVLLSGGVHVVYVNLVYMGLHKVCMSCHNGMSQWCKKGVCMWCM